MLDAVYEGEQHRDHFTEFKDSDFAEPRTCSGRAWVKTGFADVLNAFSPRSAGSARDSGH
jgi:hypothetical protein